MAKNYGFTREEMLAELKRRGVDVSQYENPAARTTQDAPAAPLTPGSETRPRIIMGLGPAIEAQKQMFRSEKWNTNPNDPSGYKGGINPLNKDWGAANLALSGERPGKEEVWGLGIDKQSLAKAWGGDDYQAYDQAAKSWEAAILPVLSGAAITVSEAQRQLRANLPQLGDTPKTLSSKAKNRAMMTNAAADLAGRPRPFPRVGTWDFTGSGGSTSKQAPNAFAPAPAAGKPAAAGPAKERVFNPQTGRLE